MCQIESRDIGDVSTLDTPFLFKLPVAIELELIQNWTIRFKNSIQEFQEFQEIQEFQEFSKNTPEIKIYVL